MWFKKQLYCNLLCEYAIVSLTILRYVDIHVKNPYWNELQKFPFYKKKNNLISTPEEIHNYVWKLFRIFKEPNILSTPREIVWC